eukprot:TRINITY_DN158_c0_g1_i14.p2 TRINITY_DN158_c0_g1~~TRINITY_DN158_c0_g1_i14.p2  ORF type:complete len:159 (-),score=19.12 TRINITY_DN158_c0_g1_i14:1541-2017(-)
MLTYARLSSIGWLINVCGWLMFGLSYLFDSNGPVPHRDLKQFLFYGGICVLIAGFVMGMVFGRKHRQHQLLAAAGGIRQEVCPVNFTLQREQVDHLEIILAEPVDAVEAASWDKREPVYGQPAVAPLYEYRVVPALSGRMESSLEMSGQFSMPGGQLQ